MIILSIETSCDETAVAVVRDGRGVLSSELFSQADMHALYGGVVPEIASRNHVSVIGRLADMAVKNAGIAKSDIDAIAVTYAPGLIGALLVGVNFAKGLALALGVPLIPVHHIRGHIAANYIAYPELEPPFLCIIVSGGNSLIVDVRGYTDIRIIGRSRDDAAGECFEGRAGARAGVSRRAETRQIGSGGRRFPVCAAAPGDRWRPLRHVVFRAENGYSQHSAQRGAKRRNARQVFARRVVCGGGE